MIAYTTLQNDSRSGFRNISTKLPSYLVQKYFGIIQWHFFHTRLMIEVFMIGPLMCTEKWQKTQQKSSWQIKLEIVNQHNVLKFINNTVFNYSWSCFTTAFFFLLSYIFHWAENVKKRKEKKRVRERKHWEWERERSQHTQRRVIISALQGRQLNTTLFCSIWVCAT